MYLVLWYVSVVRISNIDEAYIFVSQVDTPCTLQAMVNGKLKEVASGAIVAPKSKMMHTVVMPANLARVSLCSVIEGFDDLEPPEQPLGAYEGIRYTLVQSFGWNLRWLKTHSCWRHSPQ